jgi:hypothetical protein
MQIKVISIVTAGATLASALMLSQGCSRAQKTAAAGAAADEFAGSEACRQCHAEEYASWKESFHAKILQPASSGILPAASEKWASDGTGPGPATGNATGKAYGKEDVKFTVGSRWKQRYLVPNEQTGNLQLMNRQFNRASGKWENYGQKNDWNTMCATCHTTGYRLTAYDPANPKAQKSEWKEMSVGCEACHGPGSKHVASQRKADIWNFADKSAQVQARACGYCHIRAENELYKSAQGNPREDLPAPKVGETYRAGDDWTKWYPEHVVIPGVQSDDPIDKEYPGDLKGMFTLDAKAKASGVYEETKHHQEYQGFIQSAHAKKADMSCVTCHAPHGGKGKIKKVARDACASCHDPSFTVDKYMPNTGKTADNLFVKTHTFNKEPRPSSGPGATQIPDRYQ